MSSKKSRIIYGLHTVRHALEQMPENILELYVQRDKKPTQELEQIIQLAETAGIPLQRISREGIDRQSGNARHQGVLVKHKLANTVEFSSIDELLSMHKKDLFLLILDGIQDPHNLGACLRTANAAGVDAVILPRDNSAPVNATVSKVACGAAEKTAIISVSNIARTLRQLQQAGVWIVGTTADAGTSLYEVDLTSATAIVMGAEGRGLRQNTRKHCDHLARLPMLGMVESLNVSVASGICLYEVLRQRITQKPGAND